MSQKVLAIGLDAADPDWIEDGTASGRLTNLRSLRNNGVFGRVTGDRWFPSESPWTATWTGCVPQQTGLWSLFDLIEGTYEIRERFYDYDKCPPFFALSTAQRATVLDAPQVPLWRGRNSVQVNTWGVHGPKHAEESVPADLRDDLIARFGEYPLLAKDHADWPDVDAVSRLHTGLLDGARQRADVCEHLLDTFDSDLFLTVFSEPHVAGHTFLHHCDPLHPLYGRNKSDVLAETLVAIDQAIGRLMSRLDDETTLVVFSPHGMVRNGMDLPSMVFLPEFLYRFSFPNRAALADTSRQPIGPLVDVDEASPTARDSWPNRIWQQRAVAGRVASLAHRVTPAAIRRRRLGSAPDTLVSPHDRGANRGVPHPWQPTQWYRACWPRMKAFALPTFSQGFVRLNVAGREPSGIVAPADYEQLCDQLTAELHRLTNARTGEPLVRSVDRTRSRPMHTGAKYPDADLVVEWTDAPCDVAESPSLGRVGPVRYARSGGHRPQGFLMACGSGIAQGRILPEGRQVDIAPTILELLGHPIPSHMDGRPLVSRPAASRAA